MIVAMKPVKADGAKGDRKERYEKERQMKSNQRESPQGVDKLETVTLAKSEPEHRVWTDRMLKALDEGVKGGKWFSLIDKVWSPGTLLASFRAVKANGGVGGTDGQSIEQFAANLAREIEQLSKELSEGRYNPRPVRRTWIPKAGSTELRPLGIPTVRDRVVQGAVRKVIEPIFEREFADSSHGFRPGRGCKDALAAVWTGLAKEGRQWVVDADIKGYFDNISHDRLMERIEERIADSRVLALIRMFLTQGIMEDGKCWEPELGTPQGGVISPLLANIYLNPLDHLMRQHGAHMVRYADDFVVLCTSQEEAEAMLAIIRNWMIENALALHPTKTRLVNLTQPGEGFDFLGFHFSRTLTKEILARWPRKKSIDKLKESIRAETKRNNPTSMTEITFRISRKLRGWFGYFRGSTHDRTFKELDGWIRRRLRSLLRRRTKRRGISRGLDDRIRWPNDFFVSAGLFSTTNAYQAYLQSLKGAG